MCHYSCCRIEPNQQQCHYPTTPIAYESLTFSRTVSLTWYWVGDDSIDETVGVCYNETSEECDRL